MSGLDKGVRKIIGEVCDYLIPFPKCRADCEEKEEDPE